jgi:hypothetical protein
METCDRCGAQRRVDILLKTGGELMLCQYHWNEHSAKLIPLAAVIAEIESVPA